MRGDVRNGYHSCGRPRFEGDAALYAHRTRCRIDEKLTRGNRQFGEYEELKNPTLKKMRVGHPCRLGDGNVGA